MFRNLLTPALILAVLLFPASAFAVPSDDDGQDPAKKKASAEKKQLEKKPDGTKPDGKKAVEKKAVDKKPVDKKPVDKKPVDKKAVDKKAVEKALAEKKAAAEAAVAKKAAGKIVAEKKAVEKRAAVAKAIAAKEKAAAAKKLAASKKASSDHSKKPAIDKAALGQKKKYVEALKKQAELRKKEAFAQIEARKKSLGATKKGSDLESRIAALEHQVAVISKHLKQLETQVAKPQAGMNAAAPRVLVLRGADGAAAKSGESKAHVVVVAVDQDGKKKTAQYQLNLDALGDKGNAIRLLRGIGEDAKPEIRIRKRIEAAPEGASAEEPKIRVQVIPQNQVKKAGQVLENINREIRVQVEEVKSDAGLDTEKLRLKLLIEKLESLKQGQHPKTRAMIDSWIQQAKKTSS